MGQENNGIALIGRWFDNEPDAIAWCKNQVTEAVYFEAIGSPPWYLATFKIYAEQAGLVPGQKIRASARGNIKPL